MLTNPQKTLISRLEAAVQQKTPPGGDAVTIPAEQYTSPQWCEREQKLMFDQLPAVIGHAAEVRDPGDCFARDGVLVVRGADGVLRGFRNACRHRGTRLVADDAPCRRKAFVCRYHGWTYDLGGDLIHVPHEHTFGGLELASRGLAPIPVSERHGLVWLARQPVDEFLRDLGDDLDALGVADCVVHRRGTGVRSCNWKMIVDAFNESYHIRHLHRDSIYRFFIDATAEFELVGPHIRSAAARRSFVERDPQSNLRDHVTFTYFVFPNTFIVFSPDYASLIRFVPQAADKTWYEHTMLIPNGPDDPEISAHWDQSWDLLHHGVFTGEDFYIAEEMQRGLEAGTSELVFGELERPAIAFHAAVEAALRA